ncbi:MAG: type VI secretion system-associated FHA domain protein TagH [Variovorax sp.]
MIRIAVAALDGSSGGNPLGADFGPAGGSIGRSDSNTLVLSDPERTVSRVHAQVVCRNGRYFIVDRGSNPMLCNGQPLGAGNESPLTPGDRLVIGGFQLSVEGASAAPEAEASLPRGGASDAGAQNRSAPAPDDDPFADLLAGLAPPATSRAPVQAPAREGAIADHGRFPNPLESGSQRASQVDPFADLLSTGDRAASSRGDADAPDQGDFSDLGVTPAADKSLRIDDMFGGASAGTNLGGDPLAGSLLDGPMIGPNTAGGADPLAALQSQRAAAPPPRSDHLPIGQFGYVPPVGRDAVAPIEQPASRISDPANAPTELEEMQFDDMTGLPVRIRSAKGRSPIVDAKSAPIPAAASRPAPSPAPAPQPVATAGIAPAGDTAPPINSPPDAAIDPFADLLPQAPANSIPADDFGDLGMARAAASPASPMRASPPRPAVAAPARTAVEAATDPPAAPVAKAASAAPTPSKPQAPAGVAPANADNDADLIAAFLRGLASDHQVPQHLTPALMERIGTMLRTSTEGTLHLLLTRQEFKREVRADVTVIASEANNPLKFSPTVEVALAHLLGPGVRGYMPAEAAVRDAFNDLRSHQFGVMVGMRAALAHVIARFAPDQLETKIVSRSKLDNLFAASRKAKLWDQFVALYAGIATEAEDDFHSLFGKAFLEAYDEQMRRLKAGEAGQ